MEKRGARNMRKSASSGGRLDGRLSTSTTAKRTGGPTEWGVSTSDVGEGIDMRVAAAARVVAVGKVAKSGEKLSAVQLLRGVVMESGERQQRWGSHSQQYNPLRGVVMVSVVNGE